MKFADLLLLWNLVRHQQHHQPSVNATVKGDASRQIRVPATVTAAPNDRKPSSNNKPPHGKVNILPDEELFLMPDRDMLERLDCRPLISFQSCYSQCAQQFSQPKASSQLLDLTPILTPYIDAAQTPLAVGGLAASWIVRSAAPIISVEPAAPTSNKESSKSVGFIMKNGKVMRVASPSTVVSPKTGYGIVDQWHADQLKRCLLEECVVTYIQNTVPGCLDKSGKLVPFPSGQQPHNRTFDFHRPPPEILQKLTVQLRRSKIFVQTLFSVFFSVALILVPVALLIVFLPMALPQVFGAAEDAFNQKLSGAFNLAKIKLQEGATWVSQQLLDDMDRQEDQEQIEQGNENLLGSSQLVEGTSLPKISKAPLDSGTPTIPLVLNRLDKL